MRDLHDLTLAELRQANLARNDRWHPGQGVGGWSLSDWFTAAMGELGEAANVAKKLNRERDGAVLAAVTELLSAAEVLGWADWSALRITSSGYPEHPLYLPKGLVPQPIAEARRAAQ